MLKKTLVARISRAWVHLREKTISDPMCSCLHFGFAKCALIGVFLLPAKVSASVLRSLSATLVHDDSCRLGVN
jgi:hypothetical protein